MCEKTCSLEDTFWPLWHENCEIPSHMYGRPPATDIAISTDFEHKKKLVLFFPGTEKIMLILCVTRFLLSALKVKQHMAVCHATNYIHIYKIN